MKHLDGLENYSFRLRKDGTYEECDCCHYPAPLRDFQGSAMGRTKTFALCALCSHTCASSTLCVRGFPSYEMETGVVALFGSNAILDQMGAFDSATIIDSREDEEDG